MYNQKVYQKYLFITFNITLLHRLPPNFNHKEGDGKSHLNLFQEQNTVLKKQLSIFFKNLFKSQYQFPQEFCSYF